MRPSITGSPEISATKLRASPLLPPETDPLHARKPFDATVPSISPEENGITKQELSTYIIDNNLNEFIDESGDINKKKLKEHLESLNNNEYKTQIQGKNLQGRCVAIGLIFFLGAFVLVAAVAGVVLAVNGGVVVNLAAAVFGWVEVAINRANAKDQTFEKKGNDLSFEMLVSQVVSISKN